MLKVVSLFIRDPETDERTDDSSCRRADTGAGHRCTTGEAERAGQHTAGNYRAKAWNGERTCANQEANNTAERTARDCAGDGAFSGVGTGILDQLALGVPVAHRDTNITAGEAGVLQIHDGAFGSVPI
jgi:hypothetical protein